MSRQHRFSALELQRMSRKQISSLLFALQDIAPPPCVSCVSYDRCAAESLACNDFKNYASDDNKIRRKTGREATTKIFREIFDNEDSE